MLKKIRTSRMSRFIIIALTLLVINIVSRAGDVKVSIDAADKPELVLQTGHTMRIEALTFGGRGRWLASGGADATVKIWEPRTGRELRTMSGETNWIKSLAASPDGKLLAAGNLKGLVNIWDVETGIARQILRGHAGGVTSLCFSPDGQTLASGSTDKTIKLWNVASGAEIKTLAGHTAWVTALAFDSKGEWLASGGTDNAVKLWRVTGSDKSDSPRALDGHKGKITSLAFSFDDKQLASACVDGTVKLWNVKRASEERTLNTGASAALFVVYDRQAERLASNDKAQEDATIVVTGSANKTIKFWDATRGALLRTLDDSSSLEAVEAFAFDRDNQLLALGTGNKIIQLWNARAANARTAQLRTLDSISSGVYAAKFSSNNRWFATSGKDKTVKLWETATGRNIATLKGHTGWVTSVAFSPDSTLLAAGSLSGAIKVWNIETGTETITLAAHGDGVNVVAFSPDGRVFASASNDGTVKLWDAKTGKLIYTFSNQSNVNPNQSNASTNEFHALSFSPDGKTLAASGTDKTIKLWSAGNGELLRTLDAGASTVYALAFSQDGKTLASGGEDSLIKLWETSGYIVRETLKGHTGNITNLAFNRHNQLASAATDATARVWDATSGRQIYKLENHSGAINDVAFTGEGNQLVTASEDGSCRLWSMTNGEMLATIVTLADSNEWLVVAPDGLFDGSPLAWNQVLWRFARDTFNVAPVEVFFNEYFAPGLLAEIFAKKNPRAPQSISERDRRQPQVQIALMNEAGMPLESESIYDKRNVRVRLNVSEIAADARHNSGSGVQDVRLFRNGLLVRVWRGAATLERGAATLEASVPIVAGANRLTAYAFNRDNVKSADEVFDLNGALNLKRPATAYIIAFGVNEYANTSYNLKFAVPDAKDFSEQVEASERNLLGRFDKVVTVQFHDKAATKQTILSVLKRFAGDDANAPADDVAPQLALIKQAEPEDSIVFYFAGHGVAYKSRFYLMPHDLGYTGSRRRLTEAGFNQILQHSVSDLELERAFEKIDASQILFVIDACNSGQALEAEERRRGPMNSKGLAQLAYEKGMFVLTAAQSYQAALEVTEFGHGLLTYTLAEEGLRQNKADDAPRDGRVLLAEWFDYATRRVPQLYQEKMRETRGANVSLNLASVAGEENENDDTRINVQRPRVFYRRDTPVPLIAISTR